MSQENVEAFKRGLEAGNRADIDGLLDELHPEIEWHSAMHVLIGGQETVFRGHAGVRRMIGDLYETFAEVRFEMSEFRDLGDGVVAIGRQHTRGKAQRRRIGGAHSFRDGDQGRQDDLGPGVSRSRGAPRSRRRAGVTHSRSRSGGSGSYCPNPAESVLIQPEPWEPCARGIGLPGQW
jgi:ketosteroid isomerase-like protein